MNYRLINARVPQWWNIFDEVVAHCKNKVCEFEGFADQFLGRQSDRVQAEWIIVRQRPFAHESMSDWYLRLGQELSERAGRPRANDAVTGKYERCLGLVDELGGLLYLTGRGTSLFRTSNLRNRRSVGNLVTNILRDF